MDTIPADKDAQPEDREALPHLIIEPTVRDETTGALWVHKDYEIAIAPFEHEGHVGPVKADERFGDIVGWAAYVKTFADVGRLPFITWSAAGLRAVLDYHENATNPDAAGRMQWIASHPFEPTPQWKAWSNFATNHGIAQSKVVEFLEDHAPDIHEPDEATLLNLLRGLRATANATATTEMRPDGTAKVAFVADRQVRGNGDVELPAEITIAIPVIKGHPDIFKLVLKVRASVDSNAHLELRFNMPQAEVVLEQVYDELVAKAKEALGNDFPIYRSA